MIHRVSGDILQSRAHAIAYGIAANEPMPQGLARALHEQSPSMHEDFLHGCHQQHPKPGEAWMWGGPRNVRVVNVITREGGYRRGASHRPGEQAEEPGL